MKKIILCITLLLFVFISVAAQMQTGVEVGMVNSNFNTSNMYTRAKNSFKAGVFINSVYDKSRRYAWNLETGVYYQRKGAQLMNFEEPATSYIHTLNVVFDCVQVPLITGYKIPVSKETNISIKVGVYGAYAFSASGDLTGFNDNNELFNYKIDKLLTSEQFTLNGQSYALKKFTPWDFGSIVMFELGLLKNKLLVRYTIEDGLDLTKYDKHVKNHVETFGIAYNFL